MISKIALTLFLGQPLLMYGGVLTFLLLIFTATAGALNNKQITIIPFKWHPRIAVTTIVLAFVHAFFGLSVLLNF